MTRIVLLNCHYKFQFKFLHLGPSKYFYTSIKLLHLIHFIGKHVKLQIGATSAVLRVLYQTVLVKRELSWKAKPSFDHSAYVLTLSYCH